MSLDVLETGSFSSREACSPKDPLRIVSWNIARGSRLDQIIEFLRRTNADVICLQETDCDARRTGRRHIAGEIASALRMNYAFGIEFEELTQRSRESPAYHGQATLSVFPLTDSRILRFGSQSRFWHPYWWVPRLAVTQRRLGGRMTLVTHVQVGERTLVVCNLHLESRSGEVRRAHVAELLQDTRRYDCATPIVLAGDFNFDVTQNPAASAIARMHFQNPFNQKHPHTACSRFLRRKLAIDSILIRGPAHTTDTCVDSSVSASDHFPLSITLQLL